ncbi:MAG: hypothetical protein OXU96_09990 [Gammaproteobacteria bacterium]|nr:hypothetical protein [Gammaproteobacteria bacterium]
MIEETKTSVIHNWIAERLSKPLDRLWLGGVLAVNALVWAAFGVQYIGLALIAYCFIFVLVLRRRIHVAYPAEAGMEYHIGYEFDWPGWSFGKSYWTGLLFTLVSVILAFIFFIVVPLHHADVVAKSLVFLICNGFLLLRYRGLFTTCCGRGTLTQSSEARMKRMLGEQRGGAFPLSRLIIATFVLALVWSSMLVAYIVGQLGGNVFLGFDSQYMRETHNLVGLFMLPAGLALFPVLLHIIFLEISTTVLRGWGDKS